MEDDFAHPILGSGRPDAADPDAFLRVEGHVIEGRPRCADARDLADEIGMVESVAQLARLHGEGAEAGHEIREVGEPVAHEDDVLARHHLVDEAVAGLGGDEGEEELDLRVDRRQIVGEEEDEAARDVLGQAPRRVGECAPVYLRPRRGQRVKRGLESLVQLDEAADLDVAEARRTRIARR